MSRTGDRQLRVLAACEAEQRKRSEKEQVNLFELGERLNTLAAEASNALDFAQMAQNHLVALLMSWDEMDDNDRKGSVQDAVARLNLCYSKDAATMLEP